MDEEKSFHLAGLTCTQCAARFEQNVQKLPSVQKAEVAFGASKIFITGEATIADLEKAGAFDNIRVSAERNTAPPLPLWKQQGAVQTTASGILLLAGLILLLYGEDYHLTVSLFAASIAIGGYHLLLQGSKNLSRFIFDMKTLMTVAVVGAVLIGEWAEAAAVVFLFAVSEWLETYSMDKARNSLQTLIGLAPKEASIISAGTEKTIPVSSIRINDTMVVRPGEKIAMDGSIIEGTSSVNQAAVTGESIPALKTAGDQVFAGTINEDGLLRVRVTKINEDSTIAKIIHLVEEAQAERAPSQAFIDRFAAYYTPAVMVLALLTVLIPPIAFQGVWEEWIYRGLALLVVACPCALVISTPVSIVTAIGASAKQGVLIKGGIHLEEAGKIEAVAFDKTGTLTKGVPIVTDIIDFNTSENWFAAAAAIEHASQHPLAKAVVTRAKADNLDFLSYQVESFRSHTGKGVEAYINGRKYLLGNPDFVSTKEAEHQIKTMQAEGKTVVSLSINNSLAGLIAIRDELRPGILNVVSILRSMGMKKIVMLTGDNSLTAKALGRAAGIDDVYAELLPDEKLDTIRQLKTKYRTAMVGDGVNDAPALAASHLGIAMSGAGTDAALETADIALMADDLSKLSYTMKLSRRTLRIIKQNIIFSLLVKLAAILLILAGMLPLWLAIAADVGATLVVTLNGMRLAGMQKKDSF